MNPPAGHALRLPGAELTALPEKALWWAAEHLLVVSDLHLGKAERMARRGHGLVPPYEAQETLACLEELVSRWEPRQIICLGDSFDDSAAAAALPPEVTLTLSRLMAGRRWTWILGNHDPGPFDIGGTCARELTLGGITFRHIADQQAVAPEVSGHFHPKASVRGARRPAFVTDGRKLILPAFGTYTGGLDVTDPAISRLMGPNACAVLAGRTMATVPLSACRKPPSGPPARWARGLG